MQQDYQNNNGRRGNSKGYVWLFIAILCALVLWSMAGDIIRNLFLSLLAGLTPIIIALVIGFLLLKPMEFIENKLLKNCFVGNPRAPKYKRAISLSILFSILIIVIVLVIVFSIPSLVNVLQEFQGDNLTVLVDKIKTSLTSIMQSLTGLPAEQLDQAVTDAINNIGNALQSGIGTFTSNIASILMDTLSIVASTFMGLLVAFLMLKDKELISRVCKRATYAYNDRKHAEEILTVTHRTNDMLNQYVISNLIVMFIIFVIGLIGFVIMGVPMAFLMALLLGLFAIIPYLGGFIAAVPLAVVTLMFGDVNMMLMAVIFAILDWALVTTFVPAFIMSKRMNTRALVIVGALIIGGAMFGLVGMILSAPVASVIMILMQERLEVREARREHEEMVNAGILDANLADVSDLLDLSQDTSFNLPVEKEDKDFAKLQALKYKKPTDKETEQEKDSTDFVLKSKESKKRKISKNELTKSEKSTPKSSRKEVVEKTDNAKSDDIEKETDIADML